MSTAALLLLTVEIIQLGWKQASRPLNAEEKGDSLHLSYA